MRDGQNIRDVESLHPDMMGFICWEKSKRNVSVKPSYLPAVCRVGVFVNPTVEEVVDKVEMLGLNRVQLHGSESPEMCDAVHNATGIPITKVFSVNDKTDIAKYREYEDLSSVDLFLFDTKCKTVGGSGEQFDWDVLRYYDGKKPFLLAGGISPGDEWRVLSFRHPQFAGIDLNSRFETAPGIKDSKQLDKFINTIRHEQNK